jgi:dethiobiotin synthetase
MKGKAVPIASLETHVPYRFTKACSPHLAALIDKKKITIGHIAQQLSNLRKKFNGTIIVEGAGGLMVPLSTRVMMIDLIIKLRIPVVLVTHPNLGSLNHTFLSIDKLKSKNIPIAGVVINHYQSIKKNVITADNIVQITRHVSPVPVLSVDFNGSVNQSTRRFCRAISE